MRVRASEQVLSCLEYECCAAILFIVEMNHTAYSWGLSEHTKLSLLQNSSGGRYHLTETEVDELSRSKTLHAALVALSMVSAVASCADGGWAGVFTFPFVAFWVAGLARAGGRSQALRVTLLASAGWIACAAVFSLAAV